MTAADARTQTGQARADDLRAPTRTRKAVGHESGREIYADGHDVEHSALRWPLPPIKIRETESEFRISLPLDGIDTHHVYVFATPQSVLIEIRRRNTVAHGGSCEEIQNQRVTREVKFRQRVKEGSTIVRPLAGGLEITGVKAAEANDKAWSELIPLNTRSSLRRVDLYAMKG